ncbi:MAG: type I methionyl aminopeptidase [Lentisphaerae bacterium]|nr:type I methionyl aminopeptidase [Lentisphaerota bacterium]
MARDFVIHTPEEIIRIKEAAKRAAIARDKIAEYVRPGVSTKELDMIAGEIIASLGGRCAFLNYHGYPGNICISVNDEVVHGIPSMTRIIKEGDIVSLDVGVEYEGGIGDTARTVYVGQEPPEDIKRLLTATEESLEAGLKAAKVDNSVRSISAAIEAVARKYSVAVVRDFVGHGCGTKLHEPPEVPNYVTLRKGPVLQPGMVLAIEPMFNLGTFKVFVRGDGWTVCTKDGKMSAHFEHMVLITNEQPEVLTRV